MIITISQWYAIALGIIAATAVILSRSSVFLLLFIYSCFKGWFYRMLWYPLLIQRRYSGSVSRAQGLYVSAYIVMNGFCMGLGIRPTHLTTDLISRTGVMASINMVPLFLGGRTSIVVDMLGVSVHSYYLAHHWIGRVVVVQGLIHAGLVMSKVKTSNFDATQVAGLSAASASALLLVLSLHLIRKAAYEFFLGLHTLLALVFIVALSFHLASRGWMRYIYPLAAILLWTINGLARLVRVFYLNAGQGYRQKDQATVITHKRPGTGSVSGLTLTVWPKRPVHVQGGSYYYLYFSDMGLRTRFQGHPLVVSWWDDPVDTKPTSLSFLISPQQGLTRALTTRTSVRSVILDGPYGINPRLEGYEAVLLFAKGIGIAGMLPHALNLVEQKNHKDMTSWSSVMTRNVDLIWILDENCQEQWIDGWLEKLKEKDPIEKRILSVLCYLPSRHGNKDDSPDRFYKKIYGTQPKLRTLINIAVEAAPGRTMIAVCGDPKFSSHVRDLAIDKMKSSQNVTFEEVEFRPCQITSDSLNNHNWWMDAVEPQVETVETDTETSLLEKPKGTDPKTGQSVRIAGQSLSSKHQGEMASIGVALPADEVTGGGGAQAAGDQASGGQAGGLDIKDNYVAKPQSRLPIPRVLDESHLSEIEKFNDEDHKFWTIQYGAARSFQATQTKILQKLDAEEMERETDIKAFQIDPKEFLSGPTESARKLRSQFKEQVEKLVEVNSAIAIANLRADRDEFFGQVCTWGLAEPKLNNQDDFKSTVTQIPRLQILLAKPYFDACVLQQYHLNYMAVRTEATRKMSIERKILDELDDINTDIDKIVTTVFKEQLRAKRIDEEQKLKGSKDGKVDKKAKKKLKQKYDLEEKKIEVCCLVYVPHEGEADYTLPGSALGERDDSSSDDDDSDDESIMSVDDTPPHVEQPGDGKNGQSEKEPLPKELHEIRSRMGGRDGPLFALIDAYLNGGEGTEAYNEAYQKLQALSDEQDEYCRVKGIKPETYAVDATQLHSFFEMIQTAVKCKNLLKATPSDANIMTEYMGLRQVARLFIQEHQWPDTFLDTFIPTGDEILSIIAQEEPGWKAQQEQEAARKFQQEQAAQKAQEEEAARKAREEEAARKAQETQTTTETDAPPEEDTDEQCIVSVSIPGVVVEMEDGKERHKRVAGIRKCGFGNQLVLKSNGTNPDFKNRYIFELVPARSFGGALQEYKATHGDKTITTATRKDLRNLPWRRVLIAGVMSQRRKDERLYKIKAVTLVNIKFPGTGFMWASQSNLSEEFGEYVVKSKIDQYLLESGQKAPKAPTERVFKLSKKELEAQLKALSEDAKPRRKKATKEETGMTRTRKYKKKTPLKSAHPKSKTAFPDTDGEEEGDAIADESERSEDEEDSGSIIDFVVADDAVVYTDEEIAKQQALLEAMMKQRKK
ncbi:hypothetical protein V496_02645 [Pseudogymnoascus sp. VKM F-4515 (FW-2607)]|nr:hypothetical protein V496_02645 [Pseudogymnoascus sp. VKM F-4515 (FW-2607)]